MKRNLILVATLFGAIFYLFSCQKQDSGINANEIDAKAIQAARVERGKYLVSVMACDDCHTPKKMTENGPEFDMDRRFSGHPEAEVYTSDEDKRKVIQKEHVAIFSSGLTGIAGPWGVSYAANLTPDDTGIGSWTEAQFFKAIREGKSKGLDGTRPLLPPMPWQVYRNMTDEDLRSVFAYLKSIKPIKNVVPNPQTL